VCVCVCVCVWLQFIYDSERTRKMKLRATRYVLVQQMVKVRRELRQTAAQVRHVSTADWWHLQVIHHVPQRWRHRARSPLRRPITINNLSRLSHRQYTLKPSDIERHWNAICLRECSAIKCKCKNSHKLIKKQNRKKRFITLCVRKKVKHAERNYLFTLRPTFLLNVFLIFHSKYVTAVLHCCSRYFSFSRV